MSKYGVFSCPYFPVFGLNTEIYGVNLRIPSEYGKIRTRKHSVFGHLRSDYFSYIPGMPLLEIEVGQQSLTNLTELEHGKQAVCGPKLTLNKSTACINAMDTTHWKIE